MPGNADGSLDGIALKPLTVAFHEPGFIATLQQENQQPFWFRMSAEQRQRAGNPMGPANPQALNRYAYTQNNPLKYTDPSGHFGITTYDSGPIMATIHLTHEETSALWDFVNRGALELGTAIIGGLNIRGAVDAFTFAGIAAMAGASPKAVAVIWALAAAGFTVTEIMGIIGAVGAGLRIADMVHGDQGIDVHIPLPGHGAPIITAPTISKQHGLWRAPAITLESSLICDSASDCWEQAIGRVVVDHP